MNSVLSISGRVVSSLLVVAVALSTSYRVCAQEQSPPPSNQDIPNKQLEDRVRQLEQEVEQLQRKQAAPAPPAAPQALPPELPNTNEVAPRLKLMVFGDVGYNFFNHVPNTFEFGSLDLFMTGRLSDHVSTLGELLFVAQSDNSIEVDVERLLLRYQPNPHFSAALGRYHTWVGYYNTAFNKGEFLETTTDRPFMYAFDDAGGVLPMQDVGFTLGGEIPSGKIGLNYVFEAGNGRSWGLNFEPTQNSQAARNSKAINGGLFIRPESLSGFQAGFSLYHDNVSFPGVPVGETIATVHAVFVNTEYEFLNEAALVRHAISGGETPETAAFYTQFSRRLGAFRPYFRYQYFNAPSDDPIFLNASPNTIAPPAVTTFIGRVNGPSAGIRYDFTEHSAIKVQYDRFSLRRLNTENGITSQIAFTF